MQLEMEDSAPVVMNVVNKMNYPQEENYLAGLDQCSISLELFKDKLKKIIT
jgi:hypothetical protein